ncbi:MAG TPA: NAD(P)-binding domain-containing protein, partial [Balneolaceae bacterium]|nr:NAD(P)-binding domain-containing protein [Balneolaceae bacterium]
SLSLFTPSEFNNLPGMDFPAPKGHYPSKYEVADYFKQYVDKFDFPIQLNTLITKVEKEEDYFVVTHKNGEIKTKGVVVGTGPFHIPYTPPCSENLSTQIFQTHSNYYKKPDQLQEGPALVVGAGDSGFQILDEISRSGRKTYFSGDTSVKTLPQEILGKTLWWWFTKTGFLKISRDTWLGKRIMHGRQPVIGTDVKEILARENVIPVGFTNDGQGEKLMTEKETLTDVKNVVWATGYRPDFSWIKGLELKKDGYPKNQRGVSPIKNLFFIGLPWLYTRGSATLGGIKDDAAYLAGKIE